MNADTTTPAASEARSLEDLVAAMVENDGYPRARAYTDAINQGMAGMLVADHHCGVRDQPLVMTLAKLFRHVCDVDNGNRIDRRGYRVHTTINVTPYDAEAAQGHGPGLGRGPQ